MQIRLRCLWLSVLEHLPILQFQSPWAVPFDVQKWNRPVQFGRPAILSYPLCVSSTCKILSANCEEKTREKEREREMRICIFHLNLCVAGRHNICSYTRIYLHANAGIQNGIIVYCILYCVSKWMMMKMKTLNGQPSRLTPKSLECIKICLWEFIFWFSSERETRTYTQTQRSNMLIHAIVVWTVTTHNRINIMAANNNGNA